MVTAVRWEIKRLINALIPHLPPITADKGYKFNRAEVVLLVAVRAGACKADQVLLAPFADGDDKTAVDSQLLLKWWRDIRPTGGYNNTVIGALFGPAQRTISMMYLHILAA